MSIEDRIASLAAMTMLQQVLPIDTQDDIWIGMPDTFWNCEHAGIISWPA